MTRVHVLALRIRPAWPALSPPMSSPEAAPGEASRVQLLSQTEQAIVMAPAFCSLQALRI